MLGLVVVHGFPTGPRGAEQMAHTYPLLADRLAAEVGWAVLAFNARGTGSSDGDFSLRGWLTDLRAAVDHLVAQTGVAGVWLAGFAAGGSLALCLAAEDERIRGVAALGAPADFDQWAGDPRSFLTHARQVGAIRTPGFPQDVSAWAREFKELRPLEAIAPVADRPILLIHGDLDDQVSIWDARALADAASGAADLRIITGAGGKLRHDPRAVALLLGWLERQAL